MNVESWLTNKDKERIWKVVHGELSESFVTDNELKEFNRVLMIIIKKRIIH